MDGAPDEHTRILSVIAAEVLPRKLRPYKLPYPAALRCMYILALESAMRMREMYTLSLNQVSLEKRTVFLEKTKNGDKRQVPLSSVACEELKKYLQIRSIPVGHPKDLLFPWWDGDATQRSLVAMSDYMSNLFAEIFKAAACEGLKFHDLRHEATSRLFERTSLSESQIMKITGHKSHRMMMRYANLRGSDLAAKLW
ncbi:site-specific integrase [Aquabacterium sp.]|uniref:site-specific integrase n=1 Tax=Aquabacterium sp. TaxID=1872578 RepID=UPI0040376C1C